MGKSEILDFLMQNADSNHVQSMRRLGICGNLLGISLTALRRFAAKIKPDRRLALELFDLPYHEAKLLSTIIADKEEMTSEDIDSWTQKFYSWDLVDQACINLYRYLPIYNKKIFQYAESDEEFVRRTAFSLIAACSSDKRIPNETFLNYLPLIEKYSSDTRHYVYKAADWALRSIGKRSITLYPYAMKTAELLAASGDKTQRKVGHKALRELKKLGINNGLEYIGGLFQF